MSRILLVEDNAHKRERTLQFVKEAVPHSTVHQAHSFTTGCQRISSDDYDIVILDISLPTYDKGPTESGGRFRPFGGRELARKIMRRNIQTKIIFLTQYESFSDNIRSMTLATLTEELLDECGSKAIGVVRYDSSSSSWKEQMLLLLR